MKWTSRLALLIFCVVFLADQQRTLAQQSAQVSKSGPEWKQLRVGVQVATIWDTIGPKWPQTVLLQLQQNEYSAFLHAPERYVNELHVLGESSTHKVEFCLKVKIRKDAPKDVQYIIILLHEPGTVIHAMVYEIPPTPPK